jgi:hypothetical protein
MGSAARGRPAQRCGLDAEGSRLAITGLQPQPTRLLQITGASDLFAAEAADGAADALTA